MALADYIFKLISGGLPFGLTIIVGGYLTVKTKFFQFRNFKKSFSALKGDKNEGISGFSAMCNSLAAAVGTGNIVGVTAAVALGGAGTVFWMWISAFLGMLVKAAEIALGVFYRQKSGKNYAGGPHIYIKNALPKKYNFLAYLFAFFGIFASFFCNIENYVQRVRNFTFLYCFYTFLCFIQII